MTSELETVEDLVAAGNAALAGSEWAEARRCFEAALASAESVDAWEGLAWAASWLGDTDASLAAREQAFRSYRAAGDVGGASRMAGWLANDALHFRGDEAVAAGWLERGRWLLAGRPPSVDYGWLLVIEGATTRSRSTPIREPPRPRALRRPLWARSSGCPISWRWA